MQIFLYFSSQRRFLTYICLHTQHAKNCGILSATVFSPNSHDYTFAFLYLRCHTSTRLYIHVALYTHIFCIIPYHTTFIFHFIFASFFTSFFTSFFASLLLHFYFVFCFTFASFLLYSHVIQIFYISLRYLFIKTNLRLVNRL